MTHLSEEQLVLFHYGEEKDRAEVEQHLAACEACRAGYDALKQTFAAVDAMPVPERDAAYGREVWARIEPRLDEPQGFRWLDWFQPKRMVLAGAMAVVVIVAFLAGRFWPRGNDVATHLVPQGNPVGVYLVVVGEHLERSQMVLIELVNTRPNGTVNITAERHRAEELVSANRLYRQTAENVGDTAVASVLGDLERVLLEIARSPSDLSSAELAALQKRIEAKGILFKVRIIGSQVREREKTAVPGLRRGTS